MTLRRGLAVILLCSVAALFTLPCWISGFIFRPLPLTDTEPAHWGLGSARFVRIAQPDGMVITGWWQPPRQGKPVTLIVHGRSANIATRAPIMRRLAADGMGVLLFDYRGYGASAGRPSERHLFQDTMAAFDWLRRQGTSARDIVVIGQSLGNAPAAELAAREPIGALLLIAPFTDLPGVIGDRLHWLPIGALPWRHNRFDVATHLRRTAAPVILVASAADGLVPTQNARKLLAIVPKARWIDVTPLRHDGMLQAIAQDGRLTAAIGQAIAAY